MAVHTVTLSRGPEKLARRPLAEPIITRSQATAPSFDQTYLLVLPVLAFCPSRCSCSCEYAPHPRKGWHFSV